LNIGSLLRPDLILFGGNLITIDPAQPRAQAIAIRGETILAVGADADVLSLAGAGTRRTDLHGMTVVPGFNDAHNHMVFFGQQLKGVYLQTNPAPLDRGSGNACPQGCGVAPARDLAERLWLRQQPVAGTGSPDPT